MIPEIDRLYVYDQSQFGTKADMPDLDGKLQKTHFRFKRGNVTEKSAEGEVMRFAQTVVILDEKATLLFVTKNHDKKMASEFILSSVQKIMNSPDLTEKFINSTRTPKPLGIYYEY